MMRTMPTHCRFVLLWVFWLKFNPKVGGAPLLATWENLELKRSDFTVNKEKRLLIMVWMF